MRLREQNKTKQKIKINPCPGSKSSCSITAVAAGVSGLRQVLVLRGEAGALPGCHGGGGGWGHHGGSQGRALRQRLGPGIRPG